jgi:FkbH-like protein
MLAGRVGDDQLLRPSGARPMINGAGNDIHLEGALSRLRWEPTYAAYSATANALGDSPVNDTKTLRLAILRNVTVEPLIPVIEGEVALLGMHPDVHLGGFDAMAQDIFDSGSLFYQHEPDFIILFQWLDGLSPALQNDFLSLSGDDVEQEIGRVLSQAERHFQAIRKKTASPILINNFPTLFRPTLGILESQGGDHQKQAFDRLNRGLLKLAKKFSDIYCIDLASIFGSLGMAAAFDDRYWSIAKAPLGKDALVPIGQEYGRFLRALTGHARKCLVLDCDGTLWGGIVGEDGLSNIDLGLDHPGSSFVAFQREILNLYHRGVILALCSKNNEEDVLEVFDRHPNMVLKKDHFAAMRINWEDKAQNLIGLAKELNIGIDSLVFADDSPFECDRVRSALPEVAVLHLQGQPSSFRRKLSDAGLFDGLGFSDEDRKRSQSYQADKQRAGMVEAATSIEEYLFSLEIKAKIGPVEDLQIPRAAQLTQKTNQFNLTTRRYTEAEITALGDSPNGEILVMHLVDKVAEIGLIGVAIVSVNSTEATIDAFMLSCRALGRGAENVLASCVVEWARARGCSVLRGAYRQTKKNAQVADFYSARGFGLERTLDDGTDWILPLDGNGSPSIDDAPWIEVVGVCGKTAQKQETK